MKKINFVKITLDLLMSIVFVLLFNKMAVAGLRFHETAGLSLGVAFIIHIALNWKWVKQVTLKLFNPKITFKTRFGYIINVLLLFAMGYIIISGVLISKVLFPNINIGNKQLLKMLHISVSYFSLLLIGIHIGLHWTWIKNMLKKIFRITNKNKLSKVTAIISVVLVFSFGAYNIYSVNYFSRVSSIVSSFTGDPMLGPGKDMNKEPQNGENKLSNDTSSREQKISGNNGNPSELPVKKDGGQGAPPNMKAPNSSSLLTILTTYLSIIAVFSIITYNIEKLLTTKALKPTY
ncbi:hypothetical protein CPJCM30710_14970 [Clostridium polyendosporum]|uniref:Flavinylation-associated cytochrome domain-containing protein n=1 Tax=Clostridium polyendosporum TaxID=69208 RepID=A0A919VGN9_9CLOT|nr:DUF4405 domain-containing protein [Clostridium polyendosporum]GIM28831.1 hypothetical protein CPJCM30710_14970 [Clostridium polyendosporum]